LIQVNHSKSQISDKGGLIGYPSHFDTPAGSLEAEQGHAPGSFLKYD